MEQRRKSFLFGFLVNIVLLFSLAVPLSSVTVKPVSPALCPTNKIAPHRRIPSWDRPSGRTFAAYYDLLNPYSSPTRPNDQASLQEQQQSDDSDDCKEIEDYDENDLSSITPQRQNRNDRSDQRWFFGLFGNRPPQQLPAFKPPTTTPHYNLDLSNSQTQLPQRPPYWSGGLLGNNYYKPPVYQVPSDNLKPVHEASDFSDVPQTYRPDVVGGPVSHVVGHTRPSGPTAPTLDENVRRRLEYIDRLRRQSTPPTYTVTRRPRPRKLTNDNSVIGSFFDLLFK